jgi:hypothetical protein
VEVAVVGELGSEQVHDVVLKNVKGKNQQHETGKDKFPLKIRKTIVIR